MIVGIMLLSLVGTVILIGVCSPLSADVLPPSPAVEPDPPLYAVEDQLPSIATNWDSFFTNLEVNSDMQSETIKDAMRQGIVEKSIQILRAHGKSEEEIQEMMLKDFAIKAETLDELLKGTKK